MAEILWPIVSWLIREVVVKLVVLTAIVVAVEFLVPIAVSILGNFVHSSSLSSAFSAIPSGVWYFLAPFHLDFGVPLVISAYVARFLIRRLPVIG